MGGASPDGGPAVIIFSQITIKIKSKHQPGCPPLIISNMRTTNHSPDKKHKKYIFVFFIIGKFLKEKDIEGGKTGGVKPTIEIVAKRVRWGQVMFIS